MKNYVKGCAVCQQFKINRHPSHPAYIPTEGAQTTRPFANCSMDMITNLPMVNGLDSLLVIVDQGSDPTPLFKNNNGRTSGHSSFGQLIQMIQTTKQDHFRSRTTICVEILQRIVKTPRNQISIINCLSPTNGWDY